jgi:hypothetical protein
MKIFRYDKGHEAGRTITVKEMKELLDKYPDDMPVLATWENIHTFIDGEFTTEAYTSGFEKDRELCLVIDVNDY